MSAIIPENDCWIVSDGPRLSGRLRTGPMAHGVVVAHPHPVYGGSMDNPVVTAIADAYARCGFATLRFNFRGVGLSSGRFDQGQGETTDLLAAAALLADHGYPDIALAGYSFGAWVVARALAAGHAAHQVTLVSPPVTLLTFPDAIDWPARSLILAGDADAFSPLELLRDQVARWGLAASLMVSPGTDHFWGDALGVLGEAIRTHLSSGYGH